MRILFSWARTPIDLPSELSEIIMAKRSMNLDRMAVAELVQLRDEIETALSGKVTMERDELQARMDALAALVAKRSKGKAGLGASKAPARTQSRRSAKVHPLKGRKAKPKYRGPDGETWAGRGLAPRWLTALEAKGKKRESFLITR
jgi:DNA-binding protein H-NS